jgi:hypothetical protein
MERITTPPIAAHAPIIHLNDGLIPFNGHSKIRPYKGDIDPSVKAKAREI